MIAMAMNRNPTAVGAIPLSASSMPWLSRSALTGRTAAVTVSLLIPWVMSAATENDEDKDKGVERSFMEEDGIICDIRDCCLKDWVSMIIKLISKTSNATD